MTSPENFNPQDAVKHFQERVGAVKAQMGRTLVGQDMIVEGVLLCMLAGGHVFLVLRLLSAGDWDTLLDG